MTITTQNFIEIGEKKFLDYFWTTVREKNFSSDFDEILRGNSQKYGDSKYQKKILRFLFFGPIFNSVSECTIG